MASLYAPRRLGKLRHRAHAAGMRSAVIAPEKPETVTLVDGNFLLYKGFHAMRKASLTNRQGAPVGALHNFISQLNRIYEPLPDLVHLLLFLLVTCLSSLCVRFQPANSGILASMCFQEVTDPSHMAVLFDSPTSSALRRETLQTYKSSRRCGVPHGHSYESGK